MNFGTNLNQRFTAIKGAFGTNENFLDSINNSNSRSKFSQESCAIVIASLQSLEQLTSHFLSFNRTIENETKDLKKDC